MEVVIEVLHVRCWGGLGCLRQDCCLDLNNDYNKLFLDTNRILNHLLNAPTKTLRLILEDGHLLLDILLYATWFQLPFVVHRHLGCQQGVTTRADSLIENYT